MSSVNYQMVANRLTPARLASYLQTTGDSVAAAIDLYDWNTLASAALHEDLGRLEVLFRNAIDGALVGYGSAQGWQNPWYRQPHLFGRHSSQTRWSSPMLAGAQQGQDSPSHAAGSSRNWDSGSGDSCAAPGT